ncbi:unnamed protein product [Adineta ricciae]|uniref:Uncharacterized protein n=1 Tax=Adineta ricciae TaxID=249248 RepID=A0A814Y6J1_ADIRI|nr:unnamed protein product [Adineta ricciae]CAF1664821.1 unnamed protein product [Adineta ricciae]
MWKILFVILTLWINFSLARPSAEQSASEIDLYKAKTFIQDLLDRSTNKHRQAASCQRSKLDLLRKLVDIDSAGITIDSTNARLLNYIDQTFKFVPFDYSLRQDECLHN